MYGAFPLTPTRARVGSSATSKSRPRARVTTDRPTDGDAALGYVYR
jgi:hypothetical protein